MWYALLKVLSKQPASAVSMQIQEGMQKTTSLNGSGGVGIDRTFNRVKQKRGIGVLTPSEKGGPVEGRPE
jgi:hypothetical protein